MKLKEHSTNLRSKDTETAEADVLWLPSFHFVVTIVECPNNMTDAERASLMALAVESHSPFPIEQIFWGYYPELSSQTALLYMGLKEQFTVNEYAIEGAQYVFPAFLAAVVATSEYDGIQFFADDYGLSALWCEANNPLPRKVLSRRWSAFGVESPLPKMAKYCSKLSATGRKNYKLLQMFPSSIGSFDCPVCNLNPRRHFIYR